MAFENVYISKTEGDALGSFQCSLHHYKSFVHLFNFIGASQSCTQQQNSFLFATFRARASLQAVPCGGGSSLQLLLLTNCPMQLLQQAACLALWADW